MRYLSGFLCVCALGVMPLVGCSETTGDGGSGGTAGDGGSAGMPECQSPEDCDDGDLCTEDICNGSCSNVPAVDCSDGNDCTQGEGCDPNTGGCDLPPSPVADGTPCAGGTCQAGSCALAGTILPCTEQGIRNAIAAGGEERYTFDCDGPTTIVTEAEIFINNDVILDGEGQLTLVGDEEHAVLVSPQNLNDPPATAELRGFQIVGGANFFLGPLYAVYIAGEAALTLTDSTVSGSLAAGVELDGGTLTLLRSSVSNNRIGIASRGIVTIRDSEVSDNDDSNLVGGGFTTVVNSTISGADVGIFNRGRMTISNSTIVSAGIAFETTDGDYDPPPEATFANTIVAGGCEGDVANGVTSLGHNLESPGNTCGFDPDGTDLVDVPDPMLGPLQDNGGPTETHALLPGSPALDQIPAVDCEVTEDQRGVARPQGPACDVGAFELEVAP